MSCESSVVRFYVVFLSNIMLMINFISPEMFWKSMGKAEGDAKQAETVPLSMKIWVKLLLPTISLYYSLCVIHALKTELSSYEWISFFLLVFGFAFRMWCYAELGPFFTRNLGIRAGHILLKTGPYAYFVHPSYFGQILVVFNFLYLVDAHKLLIVLVALLYAQSVKFRMQKEEDMMKEHFGKEYDDYRANRWRLLPFVQ